MRNPSHTLEAAAPAPQHRNIQHSKMENRTMHTLTMTSLRNRSACLAASAILLAASGLLSGCNGALGGGTPVVVKYQGNVHGGQQPVANATIQLYAVGTTGLKSASTAMLTTTVKTDASGNFAITGLYDCSTLPATQVYITATGGDPGSGTNNALSMMTALGPCSALTPSTFIHINELTTVAATYALAPFMQDYAHIGSTGSNPAGLVNAFGNAASLVSSSAGTPGGPSLPAGAVIPVAELNTLADIAAACINTTGSTSAGMPCGTLFTATGATETIGALQAIVANPSASAITALYTLPTGSAPFQPTLTTQPKDFTVAIEYNSSGSPLSTPYAIAIDALGNALVTNEGSNLVTRMSPLGSPLQSSSNASSYGAQGIAIDKAGSIWVAATASNKLTKFTTDTSGNITGDGGTFTAGSGPMGVAVDGSNNIWVSNYNGGSVSKFTSSGSVLGTFAGSGNISQPTAVAIDSSGHAYVTTGGLNGSVARLNADGSFASLINDGALQGPQGVAVSAAGNVIVTGSTTGTAQRGALSIFGGNGATVSGFSPIETGLNNPSGIASDGVSAWIVNNTAAGGLTRLSLTGATISSPVGGFGLLNTPVGVAVDASGCVWTTNSGSNTVSKFIGLSAPVKTPIAANLLPPG